jgi:hypothetical protein
MPIPKALRAKMGETILAEWKRRLAIAGPVASRSTWAIVQTFEWVESKFSSLLALVPDLIEPYEGCDEWGASMRRYATHIPSLIALQRSTFCNFGLQNKIVCVLFRKLLFFSHQEYKNTTCKLVTFF